MLTVALLALMLFGARVEYQPEIVEGFATPVPTVLPKDVGEAARIAGYGEIADKLERAALGAVMIGEGPKTRASGALGGSRFGGDPDLPADARWPGCKGRPQTFLAQVRVRDLPAEGRELRRLGGTLLFFTHVEFEPGETEYGLWAGDCSKVIHARAGTELRRVRSPADGVLRFGPNQMRFSGRPDVPELIDDRLLPPLTDVQLTAWEPYSDFRDALRGHIYPRHKLLGYLDEPNGGDACSARAERKRGTWRHLFALDAPDELGWHVADAGRIQLLIAPEDLRRGRFDRVCGVFDSA